MYIIVNMGTGNTNIAPATVYSTLAAAKVAIAAITRPGSYGIAHIGHVRHVAHAAVSV